MHLHRRIEGHFRAELWQMSQSFHSWHHSHVGKNELIQKSQTCTKSQCDVNITLPRSYFSTALWSSLITSEISIWKDVCPAMWYAFYLSFTWWCWSTWDWLAPGIRPLRPLPINEPINFYHRIIQGYYVILQFFWRDLSKNWSHKGDVPKCGPVIPQQGMCSNHTTNNMVLVNWK